MVSAVQFAQDPRLRTPNIVVSCSSGTKGISSRSLRTPPFAGRNCGCVRGHKAEKQPRTTLSSTLTVCFVNLRNELVIVVFNTIIPRMPGK